MKQREDANYTVARFVEPEENPLFRFVEANGVRKLCLEYLKDDAFAFDPDHAVLAFPIYVLNHVKRLGVRGRTCVISTAEDQGFEGLFLDNYGPLQPLIDLKREIILI